jgi:hypothetical protein
MGHDDVRNLIGGTLAGACLGLTTHLWLVLDDWLFPGGTVAIDAALGGIAGVIWGDDFLDWFRNVRRW